MYELYLRHLVLLQQDPYIASTSNLVDDFLFYPTTGLPALGTDHEISPGFNIMDIFDFIPSWPTEPDPKPDISHLGSST